jgi:hypothetical protein
MRIWHLGAHFRLLLLLMFLMHDFLVGFPIQLTS